MSSRVYQAVFGPDDSRKGPIWNVGWTKIDASFEFYVVDARTSQGWKTFLRNHADGNAAIDLFVVPTISFRLLCSMVF
jgi:hypothetical protein